MTRRRFRWDLEAKALVEVGEDYAPHDAVVPVVTDRYMEGVRTVEGVDIGSRRKRREYMRLAGVADTSDFRGVWEKAAKDRQQELSSGNRERREAVERALYQRSTGRR